MAQLEKFLLQILRGTPDTNTGFDDLCRLLTQLGFEARIRGKTGEAITGSAERMSRNLSACSVTAQEPSRIKSSRCGRSSLGANWC